MEVISLMHLDCMTCTEMYGSGAKIGMVLTLRDSLKTQRGQ